MSEEQSVTLHEHLKGNTLFVHLQWPDSLLAERYEYAFYLKKGDMRIQTVWYQAAPDAQFVLQKSGVYYVIAFMRRKSDQQITHLQSGCFFSFTASVSSSLSDPSIRCPVSIWGSCVSRDVLEFQEKDRHVLQLKTYIARQSLVSAVSKPITVPAEIRLSSAFQRRMVQYDLEKNGFQLLQSDGSQYLILDLIDERFDLIAVDGSYATLSNEAITSGIWGENFQRVYKRRTLQGYEVEDVALESYVERFANELRKIYDPSHIILHKARMSNFYKNRQGQVKEFPRNHLRNNARINQMLIYMENKLIACLPGIHVIDLSKDFCADEKHKWGLSPMHYQEEYYKHVLHELFGTIGLLT